MNPATDTSNDTLVRRIQKLLALANNPNENEAAAAMGKVQELLAQYNLDMAVVKDANVAGGTVTAEEKREKTKVDRSAMYQWQRELWACIAESNFCFHFVTDERTGKYNKHSCPVYKKRHTILGRDSNVIAVVMMGEYLCDTIERLLPYPNVERLSRSALSWRAGCADRLMERIREQADERRRGSVATSAAAPTGTMAVTLADVYSREYAANYDAQWGAGSWAERQARNTGHVATREQRQAEENARIAKADSERRALLAAETPIQRERREKKEAEEAARQKARERRANDSYWREQDRKASRVDHTAYRAGSETGSKISLNKQVDKADTKRLG